MHKGEFIRNVQERVNLPSPEMTERAVQIVLSLLSHRLTIEERRDAAAQMPRDLQQVWNSDTWLVNFLQMSRQYQLKYRHKEELYSLIDNELDKLQIPVGAEPLTRAVFSVLKEQLAEGEVHDIANQLPDDIEHVWLSA
jgi:uncharacterized protein (DUF2267 family)